jgi:hypothetical protein
MSEAEQGGGIASDRSRLASRLQIEEASVAATIDTGANCSLDGQVLLECVSVAEIGVEAEPRVVDEQVERLDAVRIPRDRSGAPVLHRGVS